MNTQEKNYTYKETTNGNQLSDKDKQGMGNKTQEQNSTTQV